MRAETVAGSEAMDYWVDACQRTVLFRNVMRKRGNIALEHYRGGKPPDMIAQHTLGAP